MSQASYIFDADSTNFDERVVANSHKGPVLDLLAAVILMEDNYEGALQQLLEIMQRDVDFMDTAGRRGNIAIFAILGPGHPLVRKYRNRMLNSRH